MLTLFASNVFGDNMPRVSNIPTYNIDSSEPIPTPGSKVTLDGVTMTYGGWNYGADYKYNGKSLNDAYAYSTDGVEEYIIGNNKPIDENLYSFNSYNWYNFNISDPNIPFRNTFSVPCYGNYFQFEPTKSGTLYVYVIQDGICPETDAVDPKDVHLKWNPLYIVDESGRPIGIAEDTFTESKVVRDYSDDFDWSKSGHTNETTFETSKKQIIENWSKKDSVCKVIPITSGGYVVVNKSYVRYAFNVKAGKSYWAFQNESLLGFCGFAFEASTEDNKEITLDDDTDLYTSLDNYNYTKGTPVNVTLKRTFKNNTWASICLPFSVSEAEFKRVFGIGADVITYFGLKNGGRTAVFMRHRHKMLEAGRPYFILPSFESMGEYEKKEIVFENVTIDYAYNNPTPKLNHSSSESTYKLTEVRLQYKVDGFDFLGSYAKGDMSKYSYYMGEDGKFHHTNGTAHIGPYRGWLDNYMEDSALAKMGASNSSMFASDDSQTTAIEVVNMEVSEQEEETVKPGIYSISGMKMSGNAAQLEKLPAGIYIVNGKKYIKK